MINYIEYGLLIVSLIASVFWIINPTGNYEPWIVTFGMVGALIFKYFNPKIENEQIYNKLEELMVTVKETKSDEIYQSNLNKLTLIADNHIEPNDNFNSLPKNTNNVQDIENGSDPECNEIQCIEDPKDNEADDNYEKEGIYDRTIQLDENISKFAQIKASILEDLRFLAREKDLNIDGQSLIMMANKIDLPKTINKALVEFLKESDENGQLFSKNFKYHGEPFGFIETGHFNYIIGIGEIVDSFLKKKVRILKMKKALHFNT